MQQLVSNGRNKKILNETAWEMKSLGELVESVSRPTPKSNEPYLSIGIRSHGKGTFQKTVEDPDKVMMDTLYRLEANDLVVNITFAWEGAIAIATEKDTGGFVSHRFPTYRLKKKEVDLEYLKNLILTDRFIWDLGLISPGGAGRNRVMSKRDFLKLKVFVPPFETQSKIGEILMNTDNDLNLWEKYLYSLEKQKRGLMQKLLTGEIRVKT